MQQITIVRYLPNSSVENKQRSSFPIQQRWQ